VELARLAFQTGALSQYLDNSKFSANVGGRATSRRWVRLMVGSMLGPAPFILAFTFWIAATHFDTARQSKLNEANGSRAAYLRADLLPEPHRAEIRDLLREYVDVRLEAIRSWNIEQAISLSEELHSQVWSQAVAAREKTSSPIFAGHFIQSLNEVVALHARRVTVGLEFRIPNHIWYVLYAITTLAAASLGCHAGLTGASRPLVVTAFVMIISAVMILIADIDGPRRVAFRVSQQVLVDLRRAMSKP
jgi:hypothetical protein